MTICLDRAAKDLFCTRLRGTGYALQRAYSQPISIIVRLAYALEKLTA